MKVQRDGLQCNACGMQQTLTPVLWLCLSSVYTSIIESIFHKLLAANLGDVNPQLQLRGIPHFLLHYAFFFMAASFLSRRLLDASGPASVSRT